MSRIPVIAVTFIDSYFFKNTISLLNNESSTVSIYFHPTNFGLDFGNDQGSAHHHIVFDPEELVEYFYDVRDPETGEVEEFHSVSFNINDLHKIMDSIGRHGRIRLVLYQNESNLVINSQSDDESTDHLVKLKPGKGGIRDFSWFEDCPLTCRLPVTQFSVIVGSTIKRRSANMEISYFNEDGESYIEFITRNKSNNIDSTKRIKLKNPPEEEEDTMINVTIALATIRTLAKIESISPSGNLLRFYFFSARGHNCIRISSRIGTIGSYDVILKNVDPAPRSKK